MSNISGISYIFQIYTFLQRTIIYSWFYFTAATHIDESQNFLMYYQITSESISIFTKTEYLQEKNMYTLKHELTSHIFLTHLPKISVIEGISLQCYVLSGNSSIQSTKHMYQLKAILYIPLTGSDWTDVAGGISISHNTGFQSHSPK